MGYLCKSIAKIQNRAGRVITGASNDIRSVDVQWKSLETRRSHKATLMYKILRAYFAKLNAGY